MVELDESAIFNAALKIEHRDARERYLSDACGEDREMHGRIARLLRIYEEQPDFLETPPAELGPPAVSASIPEGPGTVVGRYKLLERIGEGGFAVVYEAEQTEPIHRQVALKIIRLGMDTRQVIARFEAERQALALMDHPNIAKVYDAGATDTGRPYFVMQLIHGEAITNFCDRNRLTTEARLRLFLEVCCAVQHAHQKGIIHRDIKPTNVLVGIEDGRPVPKIIDFGIAKATSQRLTERTLYTDCRQIVGTPQYMSPEQAEFSDLDVDSRSDIYSLGVLLYELLTGSALFSLDQRKHMGYDEICHMIRDTDPPTPSRRLSAMGDAASVAAKNRQIDPTGLRKLLRGDLDWILMKALEKDRTRRYATADALARDIERHLNDEPVLARPPTAGDRLQKAWRKHRRSFVAACAVAASILFGLVFFAWQFHQTLAARDSLQQQLYQSEMLEAQAAWDENQFDRMVELLMRWDPSHPDSSDRDYRDIAWYFLWKLAESTSTSQRFNMDDVAVAVAFSPTGHIVAISEPNRTLLLDVARSSMREIADHNSTRFFCFVDFSLDNQWLVCPHEDPSSVQLVELTNGGTQRLEQNGFVNQAAFSDNGNWLAVGHAGGVTLWQRAHVKPVKWEKHGTIEPGAEVTAVSFTPDSSELYLGTIGGHVLCHNLTTEDLKALERYSHDRFQVWAIACSANLVASAGSDVRVFDRRLKQVVHTIGGNRDEVRDVCFSPDGRTLVTGSRDGLITVWDTADHTLVGRLKGHSGIVQCLDAFPRPDGTWRLASASQDYTMRLWDMPAAITVRHLQTGEPVVGAVLANDASSLTYATSQLKPGIVTGYPSKRRVFGATAKTDFNQASLTEYDIRFRDLATNDERIIARRPASIDWILLSATPIFVYGTPDGQVRVENGSTGEVVEIQFRVRPNTRTKVLAALSRDGHRLALDYGGGSIKVWNVNDGRWEHTIRAPVQYSIDDMVFGDEGTTLVFASGGDIYLHDVLSGKLLARFHHHHRDFVLSLAYSHAARVLAIGSFDNTASVWQIGDSPTEPVVLRGHNASIQGIHLLEDARFVLTVGGDHCAKLWDARTGAMRLTLHNTSWPSTSAAAGRTLATLHRRSIQLLRYATREEVAASPWWREQLSKRGRSQSVRRRDSSTADETKRVTAR